MSGNACRAGGQAGNHPNYGLPHVTGAVYSWTSDKVTLATNCLFCGAEINEENPGIRNSH
jgi:hypothetical protein